MRPQHFDKRQGSGSTEDAMLEIGDSCTGGSSQLEVIGLPYLFLWKISKKL